VFTVGRFPVTLYYEQWVRLLQSADKLREFIEENKSKLKMKGQESKRRSDTNHSSILH